MRIIFSASDAGAGNSIYPLVKKLQKSHKLLVIIGGPSKQIFSSHNMSFQDGERLKIERLQKLIADFGADIFISGASLGFTIDKKILKMTKLFKIPSLYILDFWSNYWQRFSEAKKDFRFLPDVICVMDKKAKAEMVGQGFDPKIIEVTGSPYFDEIKKRKKVKKSSNRIVFVSQPLSKLNRINNVRRFVFDEVIIFEEILSTLKNIGRKYEIVVRLHPSESADKFKAVANMHGMEISFDNGDLVKCLSASELVVGLNSSALLVANLLGKDVISYFPGTIRDIKIIRKCLGIKAVALDSNSFKELIENYFKGKLGKTTVDPFLVEGALGNIIGIISHHDQR